MNSGKNGSTKQQEMAYLCDFSHFRFFLVKTFYISLYINLYLFLKKVGKSGKVGKTAYLRHIAVSRTPEPLSRSQGVKIPASDAS